MSQSSDIAQMALPTVVACLLGLMVIHPGHPLLSGQFFAGKRAPTARFQNVAVERRRVAEEFQRCLSGVSAEMERNFSELQWTVSGV